MSLRIKVVLTLSFFVIMDVGVSISDYIYKQVDDLEYELSFFKSEYDGLYKNHVEMQTGYRETLVNIVENLYTKESYRNVGGVSEELVQNNELLHQAIINATTPFNVLLSNIDTYFSNRKKYLDNIPSTWPVMYNDRNRITSPFGIRISPLTGVIHNHSGIDISGDEEEKIIATAEGIVKEVWIGHVVYGKMIMIDHQNGYRTLYGHLSKTLVRANQMVKRGQVIGIMGNTGQSMGLHLHYEVFKDDKRVNPIDYLASNNLIAMGR